MALQEGFTEGTITEHSLRTIADKPVVQIRLDVDGDMVNANIWLTERAMGIARQQLKRCGFDVDSQDLELLQTDPTLLAGNKVPLNIEDYKGQLQAKIRTQEAPPKKQIRALQEQLRAKGSGAGADDDEDIPF